MLAAICALRGNRAGRAFLITVHRTSPQRCYGDKGSLHLTLEPLEQSENEGIFQLTLTRPDARNALGEHLTEGGTWHLRACVGGCPCSESVVISGRKLLRELAEALSMVTKERATRCVVVRSAVPGVFCAGADLKVSPCCCV